MMTQRIVLVDIVNSPFERGEMVLGTRWSPFLFVAHAAIVAGAAAGLGPKKLILAELHFCG
jgi:hypothetical protein